MVRHNRTEFTEQMILNFALDEVGINPPTSMRAMLQFVDGKGWVRVPYNNTPPRVEIEYDGDNLKYEGHNLRSGAAVGDADWIIQYSIYDGVGNFLRSQTLIGAWTGRPGLPWSIS